VLVGDLPSDGSANDADQRGESEADAEQERNPNQGEHQGVLL
jgi:hypothetical protein